MDDGLASQHDVLGAHEDGFARDLVAAVLLNLSARSSWRRGWRTYRLDVLALGLTTRHGGGGLCQSTGLVDVGVCAVASPIEQQQRCRCRFVAGADWSGSFPEASRHGIEGAMTTRPPYRLILATLEPTIVPKVNTA